MAIAGRVKVSVQNTDSINKMCPLDSFLVRSLAINMETAKKCAINYNIEAVTVEELLKDKEIEIILNLTIPRAHFEVSKMALENGKHSYAEKPMAVNFEDGKKLVELAKEKNLYIGNAPDTFWVGVFRKLGNSLITV